MTIVAQIVRLLGLALQAHLVILFFFFNDTATTEIYTLSLHDALPISHQLGYKDLKSFKAAVANDPKLHGQSGQQILDLYRSEEHTSELQSRLHLVCRLLLEKKKKK